MKKLDKVSWMAQTLLFSGARSIVMNDMIADRYKIIEFIGKGSTGEVYLVEDRDGKRMALKLLRDFNSSRKKKAMAQFENEFKILSLIKHPFIGQIYDFGLDRRQNKIYFTMPYIEKNDLGTATLGKNNDYVLGLFMQILEALDFLHESGITHGDLKPNNILVRNQKVKLIDFGYAAYSGAEARGTPMFMAPELFDGKTHSPQSDLYALGVSLHYCLKREFPIQAKNNRELIEMKKQFSNPANIKTISTDRSFHLDQVLFRLMAPQPSDRYASARELIAELGERGSRFGIQY